MFSVILALLQSYALTIVLSSVILVWMTYQWLRRPPNFPPGPIGLPVIGVSHKLSQRAEVGLMKLSQEYGPIMGVKLLRNFTVILSDLEVIQQAFAKQGHVFSGRPKSEIFKIFTEGRGIIAVDGPTWKENRKFGTAIFRKLGAGRKIMEERIVEEMICMCSALQVIKGNAFDIANLVTHSAANVLCSIAFGDRYDYNDLEFITVARTLVDWFADNADAFLLMVLAPIMTQLPPYSGKAKSLAASTAKLYSLLLPIIESHKESLDTYEYRDFVDAYLMEMAKQKDNPSSVYSNEELKGVVRDFFVGGTDTTATAIKWTLIFLINRPQLQKKIQKEIDKVIGPDARPKMTNLDDMHFTKAVLHEILRFRTPGPLGLAHRVMEDTKLMGYDIPKDTQVISNFWAIHHDPKLWDKPEEFIPERFLNNKGKFQKSPYLVPFSVGARYCMGESMARMEHFFFVCIILQRFHLEPESPDAPPIQEECSRSGQFLIAPRFKMTVRERFCRGKSIKEYQQSMWE